MIHDSNAQNCRLDILVRLWASVDLILTRSVTFEVAHFFRAGSPAHPLPVA